MPSVQRGMFALGLVALIVAGTAGFALAQTLSVPAELRVVAQKHASGAVEVGIEQDGERYLPDSRFVSAGADEGRWLRSSPVTIEVEVPEPEPRVIEVPVEVPVEVRVEVPVEEPVVPLSVRPSDHPNGFVCLEAPNDEGHTWTWADDEVGEDGELGVTGYTAEFGLYLSGVQRGWATALRTQGLPQSVWQQREIQAAWHAQCASYYGIDLRVDAEYATDPDDWSQ